MIQRLDHTDSLTAESIRTIFQKSYAVEAELLGAKDFPPIKRTLNSLLESTNVFYGFYMDGHLAALTEIAPQENAVHIQSLVVLPDCFKMGIASGLLSYVFVTYPLKLFSVETGLKNTPAIALYKKFGFIETKQWDTDHGIRKVRFEKTFELMNSS